MNRMKISVPGIDPAYLNYETAKEHLYIRLCSPKENRDFLKNVPHTSVQDMEATYHLLLPGDGNGITSIIVDHEVFGHFNISKEQLHQDAIENTPKLMPPVIYSMPDVLSGLTKPYEHPGENWQNDFKRQLKDIDLGRTQMYVLSNSMMLNGAAVICYPQLMQRIGEQVKQNFFILPSSVHEVLLVPDNGVLSLKDLEQTVKDVNTCEVMPADRLSDSVYHFDVKAKLFERGSDFEARQNERAHPNEKVSKMKKGYMERESITDQLERAARECEMQPLHKTPARQQMLG